MEVLYHAIELKRNLIPTQYLNLILKRDKIIERLSILLIAPASKNRKDLCAFHKRIQKYKEYVFTFLFYEQVHNASDEPSKMQKVKQKISGQFKTENFAQLCVIIRSVTDTCLKNGHNVLNTFKTIAI